MLVRGTKDKEPAMAETLKNSIAFVGIDIGKNSFHVVGISAIGTIVLRQKWSRGQVEARFANMPPCLIGMEACVGAHRRAWCGCSRNWLGTGAGSTGASKVYRTRSKPSRVRTPV